jgi:Zn-dependent protease
MEFNIVQIIATIAIYAIPVVFAITLHEAAHGYVAKHFGDLTALRAGRITLNPLKHIDPMGTVIVPVTLLFLSKALGTQGILFGWAKPVPVNFSNLRHPKQDMLWVAAAGPGINFAMALFWAFVLKAATIAPDNNYSLPLKLMSEAGISINAVLMILNLLPVPPLDGGRIAVSLLPAPIGYRFAAIEPYGLFIILALLFTGILSKIMGPFIGAVIAAVLTIADL